MPLFIPLLLALNFCIALGLHAEDSAGTQKSRFPAPYSDYQIVIGSISHDERFAAILRDGSDSSKNYLVLLSPFRVLTEIPTDASFIDGGRQSGLTVNWNQNNSAAVIFQEGKFGPEKIYVLELANDKVVKTTNLLAILQDFVRPDFKKSGADRFNDNFDFFLDEDESWTLNAQNQIPVDCEFTNDPRLSARISWTGRLSGTWDEKSGKLVNARFNRSGR